MTPSPPSSKHPEAALIRNDIYDRLRPTWGQRRVVLVATPSTR